MKRTIEALTEAPFDLVIVGGGITGAGVALDASLRGLRVALLEKGDFASGTSSVSSKLIHGGLRYLEHGAFGLVYEALHERRLLLQNAPHLVRPQRFVIPYCPASRVPTWRWRLGLAVYDTLAGSSNIRRSRPLSASQMRAQFPALRAGGVQGGAEYYDAQMDDARLCLEVVLSAARQGACVANYVEATGFEFANGFIQAVRARDRVSGKELLVRGRQFLNATGPWVDAILRLAGDNLGARLRPTKGVHLVLPGQGLAAAFLLLHPADGRVFFVVPWLRKTLVGTTDTPFDDSPDLAVVTSLDVQYLLEGYNHYFSPPATPKQVCGQFVGVRPLLRGRAEDPSALSREFRLLNSASGLLSAAGGKYTTFRHMAEVITDEICRRLKLNRSCRTRDFPLFGTPAVRWDVFAGEETKRLSERYGLSEAAARHLVDRYGSKAAQVAEYVSSMPDGSKPVVLGEPDLCGEFRYQREHELAIYPQDFLLRRTRLGLFHPELLERLPSALDFG